jgi:hypothetical protein
MYEIYVFWVGKYEMSENRKKCLESVKNVTEGNIIFITDDNLKDYILETEPIHPAYEYLSETHKADYLRTYFMHFYGGGYCDIKQQTGSWRGCFDELYSRDDIWICGYEEVFGGVAYDPHEYVWYELVGNCSYICKPKTPLTERWYNAMVALLDSRLDHLKLFPATYQQDCSEFSGGKYPIGWNEMLGRIFHNISYEYKEKLLITLPAPKLDFYR